MTRETAIRILTENINQLKDRISWYERTDIIKLAESRIDAMELAIEEMHRLAGLEK